MKYSCCPQIIAKLFKDSWNNSFNEYRLIDLDENISAIERDSWATKTGRASGVIWGRFSVMALVVHLEQHDSLTSKKEYKSETRRGIFVDGGRRYLEKFMHISKWRIAYTDLAKAL